MTEEFALKFANKVKDIVMKESNINGQKVPSFEEYDFIYNTEDVFKNIGMDGGFLINVHML